MMAEIGAPPPPIPYASVPAVESRTGSAGTDATVFAMGNHQHPRLTSAGYVTTAGDGTATVSFTRSFPTAPTYTLNPVGNFGQSPPMANVTSWVQSGSDYVGANIKAVRPANSAPLAAVTVLGISVSVGAQVVTPVFSDAGGVLFSCTFLMQS